MTVEEAMKLLLLISQFDGRPVNTDAAQAWAFVLDEVPIVEAVRLVRAHYTGPRRGYRINPGDLVALSEEQREKTRWQLDADVRAARGYGIIDRSAPDDYQMTLEEHDALEAKRAEARTAVYQWSTPNAAVAPIDYGVRTKRP